MPVEVPTAEDVRAEYVKVLNLVEKTPQIESAYLKARGKAEFGDAAFQPVYHHVCEATNATIYKIVGGEFIKNHKDAQMVGVRRNVQTIKRFLDDVAKGRKATVYFDWEIVKDEPHDNGVSFSYGIKAIFATA